MNADYTDFTYNSLEQIHGISCNPRWRDSLVLQEVFEIPAYVLLLLICEFEVGFTRCCLAGQPASFKRDFDAVFIFPSVDCIRWMVNVWCSCCIFSICFMSLLLRLTVLTPDLSLYILPF